MKLLALDMSTKSTGYCIFEDKKIVGYGCLTAGGSDPYARIFKIKEQIKDIYERYLPDEVTIEEIIPADVGHKQDVFKTLMYLQAVVVLYFYIVNKYFPITFQVASHWRSNVGIQTGRYSHRQELKEASIQVVKNKYGIDVNDDTADAICLGISYYKDQDDEIINKKTEERAF